MAKQHMHEPNVTARFLVGGSYQGPQPFYADFLQQITDRFVSFAVERAGVDSLDSLVRQFNTRGFSNRRNAKPFDRGSPFELSIYGRVESWPRYQVNGGPNGVSTVVTTQLTLPGDATGLILPFPDYKAGLTGAVNEISAAVTRINNELLEGWARRDDGKVPYKLTSGLTLIHETKNTWSPPHSGATQERPLHFRPDLRVTVILENWRPPFDFASASSPDPLITTVDMQVKAPNDKTMSAPKRLIAALTDIAAARFSRPLGAGIDVEITSGYSTHT